jgi:hypothetical protein
VRPPSTEREGKKLIPNHPPALNGTENAIMLRRPTHMIRTVLPQSSGGLAEEVLKWNSLVGPAHHQQSDGLRLVPSQKLAHRINHIWLGSILHSQEDATL